MNTLLTSFRLLAFLLLSLLVSFIPSNSYATPSSPSVSVIERDGTLRAATGYRPAEVGPEYRANPPTYRSGDTYAQDEIIVRFRPDVSTEQQNALMSVHGMRFGRPIYGDRAFVAKVPVGTAMVIANALTGNPMLEIADVNPLMRLAYEPNDEFARRPNPQQGHLEKINAYGGWDYGHGLGAVSRIAILDSGIDMGGSDGEGHPEFTATYRLENWVSFVDDQPRTDHDGHGTHVGGLAAGGTDNTIGIAATGFTAWPMSVKILGGVNAPPVIDLSKVVDGVNWASDHGASVINISAGCPRTNLVECGPQNKSIKLLKEAIDRAYARGISVVVAMHNGGSNIPYYPAAFGQLHLDDPYWAYNEQLVIAVAGTMFDAWHPQSNYGTWADFSAPFSDDSSEGIWSTYPTEHPNSPYYHRRAGTSMSTPQVAGLASLLTSLGYSNNEVWEFIKQGATDLYCDGIFCEGYDQYTGWGRINMGQSMALAERITPGMAVVPNAGKVGVQWFNFQGSGFAPNIPLDICWGPVGQQPICDPYQFADGYGVGGLGIQIASDVTGVWSVSMCEVTPPPQRCTPTKTFTVLP